jgi:hypothetical protein
MAISSRATTRPPVIRAALTEILVVLWRTARLRAWGDPLRKP